MSPGLLEVGVCRVTAIRSVGIDRDRSGVLFYALYYMAWYPRHPGSGGGAGREMARMRRPAAGGTEWGSL